MDKTLTLQIVSLILFIVVCIAQYFKVVPDNTALAVLMGYTYGNHINVMKQGVTSNG